MFEEKPIPGEISQINFDINMKNKVFIFIINK